MTKLIMPLVLAALIVGAVLVLNKKTETHPTQSAINSEIQAVSPVEINFDLKKDQEPELQSIRVKEGQNIIIQAKSEISDEIHLHGYDLKTDISPDKVGKIEFVADKTGRFDMELEQSAKPLGVLEVYPK